MSQAPEHVGRPSAPSTDIELSEQQLFQLATGEPVTIELVNRSGVQTVTVEVEPPKPFAERESSNPLADLN